MAARVSAAGFVLTGGQSRRMGRDKALLEVGGQPVVWRVVERLRLAVVEVFLVGAPERYAHLGIPAWGDRWADRGPLAGIVTALGVSRYDWNLVVACDLPYLETRFLEFLLEQAGATPEADAIVPQTQDTWQPLCAAYHRRCLSVFERVLAEGHPKIARAFSEVRVRAITPDELERFAFSERMFKNMNTPEDYAEAQRILGS